MNVKATLLLAVLCLALFHETCAAPKPRPMQGRLVRRPHGPRPDGGDPRTGGLMRGHYLRRRRPAVAYKVPIA
ncbi:unnamed protein product [Lampetra planeri]